MAIRTPRRLPHTPDYTGDGGSSATPDRDGDGAPDYLDPDSAGPMPRDNTLLDGQQGVDDGATVEPDDPGEGGLTRKQKRQARKEAREAKRQREWQAEQDAKDQSVEDQIISRQEQQAREEARQAVADANSDAASAQSEAERLKGRLAAIRAAKQKRREAAKNRVPQSERPSRTGQLQHALDLQKKQADDYAKSERQSALSYWKGYFGDHGLEELWKEARPLIRDGLAPEQVMVELRKTESYAKRFPGQKERTKSGLPPLNEADYLAQEVRFREVAKGAGLPKGLYDNHDDFGKFIGAGIGAEELQERIKTAGEMAANKDKKLVNELKSRGLGDGDIAAFVMDPERALPAIKRKLERAAVGAEARRFGMAFGKTKGGKDFENRLADQGVTKEEAATAFRAVEEERDDANFLAGLSGGEDGFTDRELAREQLRLDKDGNVGKRRKTLRSQERARWSGSGGGTAAFGDDSSL